MVGKSGVGPLLALSSSHLSLQLEESAQEDTAVPTPIMSLGTLALPGTYSACEGPSPQPGTRGLP